VAAGFVCLALRSSDGRYWSGVFPGVALLAVGMGLAVAPLTDAVLGAVSRDHEGAASGVNNAVARVAGLLAVALAGFALGGAAPGRWRPATARPCRPPRSRPWRPGWSGG